MFLSWRKSPKQTNYTIDDSTHFADSDHVYLDDSLIKVDSLGQTLVATVIDSDLTAQKVADLAVQLQAYLVKNPVIRNLVIDLQDVEYMDSSCLNMLIQLLHTVTQNGGKIAVASLHQQVEVLFKLTRLDQVFPIRHSVMDAIDVVERAS